MGQKSVQWKGEEVLKHAEEGCMKHLGEANRNKFDKGLVRRKMHKSGIWEKGMESQNEVCFPCVQSQHSGLLGVGGSSGWQWCSSGQASLEIFWEQFEIGDQKTSCTLTALYGWEDKCLMIHCSAKSLVELKTPLKIPLSVKPF